uniref:Uncharacterized protein n=1 Tax=Cereibacter sphaeroides (strain ATCC 17025 / ATH 2.4.3) TaxID=349102 RepID=A4WXC7_CERS5
MPGKRERCSALSRRSGLGGDRRGRDDCRTGGDARSSSRWRAGLRAASPSWPAGGTCLDLKFALIGTVGRIHRGRPSRGESLVLICAKVFIERLKAAQKLLSRHTSRDVMAEHAELFVTWAA